MGKQKSYLQRGSDRVSLTRIQARAFLINLFWSVIYKYLLEFIYVHILTKRWAYAGFTFNKPSLGLYLISWLLLFFSALCLTQIIKLNYFSSLLMGCLIILYFIPGIVFFTYRRQEIYGFFLVYYGMFVFWYILLGRKHYRPLKISIDEKVLEDFSVLIFLFCVYVWARYAHFHLQLDLFNVYDQRRSAYSFNMTSIGKYLYGSFQVCIPTLVIWSLNKGKKNTFIILVVAQVLAFFSQGSKSAFFALVIGIAVHFVIDNDKTVSNLLVLKGITSSAVVCIIESIVFKSYYVLDYLFRRTLYLPILLNVYYYDFFTKNELDYFRSSVLRFIGLKSPYAGVRIPNLIGRFYFHAPAMYANNGLFSDAYMNLGTVGFLVMPLLIVLLFKWFDLCLGNARLDLQVGSAVYIIFCLIGSSFFTNLFTHGFILMGVLFCIMEKDDAISVRFGK